MFLSDLQNKDIISTRDGRKVGNIIDVEITPEGCILYLIVEEKKISLRKIISTNQDTKVSFKDITKIGKDVILVNI